MFLLNGNTRIDTTGLEHQTKGIENAVAILKRDQEKVFYTTDGAGGRIVLRESDGGLMEEQYRIKVRTDVIEIWAEDELGFIYGLLHISKTYMGILPFWFWMDQKIEKRERELIEETDFLSEKRAVRFRGWFYNDEVLLLKWNYNQQGDDGWKMAFEALLRCGGNITIPGTDKMSIKNRQLASDMGLWITHHHAEPLGAGMFVRAYPELPPNYLQYQQKFLKIWEEGVAAQKNYKVVWNVGFRGQGDAPFWEYDTTGVFDTPAKRGKLISDIIKMQCDLVRRQVEHPIFCTNLYGEIIELYDKGYIELADDIIRVRADNGYGRMVSRRRENHAGRAEAMPNPNDTSMQGIYYHVSFYDLQAANHITMLPNSVEFVNRELQEVLKNRGDALWIINCSNVRPHTYYMDALAKIWNNRVIGDEIQSTEFAGDYFGGYDCVAACFRQYAKSMISYGTHEDEHSGEQFYTENVRLLAHQIIADRANNCREVRWLSGDVSLTEQVEKLCGICAAGLSGLQALQRQCQTTCAGISEPQKFLLFETTLGLQAYLHAACAKGTVLFGSGYAALQKKDFERAFVLFGNAASCFERARQKMRDAEYGVWEGFYLNDCFADVGHTAYMLRKLMGYVRELGDNGRHDAWYRKYCLPREDQGVFLQLVFDQHMEENELYLVMRQQLNMDVDGDL